MSLVRLRTTHPFGFVLILGALCLALSTLAPARSYAGDPVSFGPYDLRSLFHIEKSENQNQIHYGVRLDANCHPQGVNPVFGYWRRVRGGTRVDDPLVGAATRVYGTGSDQRVQQTSKGGVVTTYVKALKTLPIEVTVEKGKDGCVATPMVTLKNERVKLLRAFLQLGRFGITVKYVDVYGAKPSGGPEIMQQFN